jgi:hypothetical protein
MHEKGERMMNMQEIRLSEIWLFGTRKINQTWTHEDALECAMHTHPDGRYMDEPTMNEIEAEELLRTGIFPDNVWERLRGQINE